MVSHLSCQGRVHATVLGCHLDNRILALAPNEKLESIAVILLGMMLSWTTLLFMFWIALTYTIARPVTP